MYLWTADAAQAWTFADRDEALGAVKRFPDVLDDCEVVDR